MQSDIVERLEQAIAIGGSIPTETTWTPLLTDALKEILRLRGLAGAVSPGPSLREIKDGERPKTTGL